MMTEERLAYRIRQGLNQSLGDIPPSAARRLEAARHHALNHQKQPVAEWAFAGSIANGAFARLIHGRDQARHILAMLALLLGMAIAFYWHAHQYVNELEDVDSALLTDALPPDAFLDKGFAAWLHDSSED